MHELRPQVPYEERPAPPEVVPDCQVSVNGLAVRVVFLEAEIDETVVIEADSQLTKYVQISQVFNSVLQSQYVVACEKTDGSYAEILSPEYITHDCGEFSVVANGTELVQL